MPFEWSDFIDLAEWLRANATTPQPPADAEAAYRSAVSRAYYGAFQLAMALLVRKREYAPTHTGDDHKQVIAHFQRHSGRPRQQIGTQLDRLRNRRRQADYEVGIPDAARLAEASVRDAKEVRASLRAQ